MSQFRDVDNSQNQPITAHEGAQIHHAPVTIRISLGKETLVVVVALILVIGATMYVLGLNMAKQDQMDRDYKEASTRLMLNERRLMDKEAYMILNGEKIPGDDMHGPTGNLSRMQPKESDHGRR